MERVIESQEVITLSARDWDAFREALINPAGPERQAQGCGSPLPWTDRRMRRRW